MVWKSEKFLNEFNKKGYGLFCGKFSAFPVSRLSSIIVKNRDDLILADLLMQVVVQDTESYSVRYDKLV